MFSLAYEKELFLLKFQNKYEYNGFKCLVNMKHYEH